MLRYKDVEIEDTFAEMYPMLEITPANSPFFSCLHALGIFTPMNIETAKRVSPSIERVLGVFS
jgi:hypothetical protein